MKRLLACTLLTVALLGNTAAQDLNIQHSRVYAIKHDRLSEWESTIKDLNALYKKASIPAPTIVLQSLTGQERFVVIRYYGKISDALASRRDAFKGNHEGDYMALINRLMSVVDDRETRVAERNTELSLPIPASLPPYVRRVKTVVKPDRVDDYLALTKEFVNAGVKPSGAKTYVVNRTRMGGPATEFISGLGIEKLSELDDIPARKTMGEAKYNAWLAKRNSMIISSEIDVYRVRMDLSSWTAPK